MMAAVNVTLNGKARDVRDGTTVAELVAELKLADGPIAVERNREVLPKSKFAEVTLREGDRIEIVHFVGGG